MSRAAKKSVTSRQFGIGVGVGMAVAGLLSALIAGESGITQGELLQVGLGAVAGSVLAFLGHKFFVANRRRSKTRPSPGV